MSQQDNLKNERRIKKIGGRLQDDYQHFRNSVLYINDNYLPLFYLLGFNEKEDKETVIDCLLKDNITYAAREAYIKKGVERITSGKLKPEKLLSSRIIKKEYPTTEEKEKIFAREAHRALIYRFKNILDSWKKEYFPTSYGFSKTPINICREALCLSSEGLTIDVDKFIEIYSDHLQASGSKRGKLHQEAADAINRFFNGATEITIKEIEKYFILNSRVVKPNPSSMNGEDYLRLG